MRVLLAASLLGLSLAFSASAQHGGVHGGFAAPSSGGFHGGFSAPASGGFHGSVSVRPPVSTVPRFGPAPVARSPYAAVFGARSLPRASYPPSYFNPGARYGSYAGGLRVVPSHPRIVDGGRAYPRTPRVFRTYPIAPLYPYPFFGYTFLNPFWGLGEDDFLYNNTGPAYPGTDAYAYPGTDGFASPDAGQPAAGYAGDPNASQPPAAADGYGPLPPADGNPNGPLVYAPAPAYPPPQTQVYQLQNPEPQPQEDALVVFFNDGRPPIHIRNYALTRSALVIVGPRAQEIPLAVIDLPTTERVNRVLGVDFRLPLPN